MPEDPPKTDPAIGSFFRDHRRLLILVGAWVLGFVLTQWIHEQPVVDEVLHRGYIKAIASGADGLEAAREQLLPMIPGYHYGMATVARVTGTNIRRLRTVSFALSLLLVPALLYAADERDRRRRESRALSVLLIPFLPVMGWLVYTDIAALLFCVLAFGAWRRDRRVLAGVALLMATLMRQNSAVLGVALLAIDGVAERRERGRWTLKPLARGWPLLLGFVPLVALWVWLSDVVLTRTHQSPRPLHLTQVWFFLLLQGIVLLPSLVRAAPSLAAGLRSGRGAAAAAVLGVAYWITATVDHPWNLTLMKAGSMADGDDWLMDVWLGNPVGKVFGLILCLATAAYIVHDSRRSMRPEVPLGLLAGTLLMLAPSWLLCVRYDLMPMTFFALTGSRCLGDDRVGWWWSVALTLLVTGLFLGDQAFW